MIGSNRKRRSIHPLSYLAGQRNRRRTTWSCTVWLKTQSPWEAEAGWASWAGIPGYRRGAQCQRCTPTAIGRRAPGRQTCPPCALPCAAKHPQSNPCSAWWSPPHSLAQAWWSGRRVPHRHAVRSTVVEKKKIWFSQSDKNKVIWSHSRNKLFLAYIIALFTGP